MRPPALVFDIDSLADFAGDRRFCIVLCLDHKKDQAYYDKLWAWTGKEAPGPGTALVGHNPSSVNVRLHPHYQIEN